MQNENDKMIRIQLAKKMPGWALSIVLAVLVTMGITVPMNPDIIGVSLAALAMVITYLYYTTYNTCVALYNENQMSSLYNELAREFASDGTFTDELGLTSYEGSDEADETEDK